MRILLVDDHFLVRSGLKMLLAGTYAGAEIREAEDASSALKEAARGPWDLIVLDLNLPDRGGLDLVVDFRKLVAKTPILVVSGEDEMDAGRKAFAAGVNGFVHKTAGNAEIISAVRRVMAGKKYVSPDLAANILETGVNERTAPHELLSTREQEVLRSLGRGLTISEIGQNLGLSAKTISTYRTRIAQKLGLTSTGELVRYAVKNGLA